VRSCLTLILACCVARALDAQGSVSASCDDADVYYRIDGADTLSVERLRVRGSSFESSLLSVSQGALLRLSGILGEDGSVRRIRVAVWHSAGDSARMPTQQAEVVFAERLVSAVVLGGSRLQPQVDTVPAGTLPFMEGHVLFMDLVRRRSLRRLTGADTIPVLWLFTAGQVDTAVVFRSEVGALTIQMRDATTKFELLKNGRLGSALVSVQPRERPGSPRTYRVIARQPYCQVRKE